MGALIRGRRKSKRRRASPEEVWALRYECERSNSLERENVRLRDQVSRLVIRVWELEDKLKDPRAELTAASEGMGV